MSKKNKNRRTGIIFSTDPDFDYSSEQDGDIEEMAPNQQRIRVMIDRKKRRGKSVTLVTGFEGPETILKELGKFLKSKCGVGGTVKDGEIMIQGEFREKVVALLKEKGYTNTKPSG